MRQFYTKAAIFCLTLFYSCAGDELNNRSDSNTEAQDLDESFRDQGARLTRIRNVVAGDWHRGFTILERSVYYEASGLVYIPLYARESISLNNINVGAYACITDTCTVRYPTIKKLQGNLTYSVADHPYYAERKIIKFKDDKLDYQVYNFQQGSSQYIGVERIDIQNPLYNLRNPFDVNGDGKITTEDLPAFSTGLALNYTGSNREDREKFLSERFAGQKVDINNDQKFDDADASALLLKLAIIDKFHNKALPCDVNRDGVATAQDVLNLSNQIGKVGQLTLTSGPSKFAFDLNADGQLSSADAILAEEQCL